MNKRYAFLTALAVAVGLMLAFAEPSSSATKGVIKLSDKNTVVLNLPINEETSKDVQLLLMQKSDSLSASTPIYLFLNSPGGDIDAGFKVIETAQGLPQEVRTISMFSASMSFIISQYLGTRYILESGTMMSHRAFASGLEGQVPGNLNARVKRLTDDVLAVESHVAARAHLSLEQYQKAVADELWLKGPAAVYSGYADQVTKVFCDSSLRGPGQTLNVKLMGLFNVKITWDKCPLVAAPLAVEMSDNISSEAQQRINTLLTNRAGYLRSFGENF